MKKIRISDDCDRKLERLAPPFLKGKRLTTKRVQWAVERLLELLAGDGADRKRKAS